MLNFYFVIFPQNFQKTDIPCDREHQRAYSARGGCANSRGVAMTLLFCETPSKIENLKYGEKKHCGHNNNNKSVLYSIY